MNRSPLHGSGVALGARFIDFGGWEMPLRYESVLTEHRAVRADAGVFDLSHLGRFELSGPGAHEAVSTLLCNDIQRIAPGRCQYTMMLNGEGGIIDDMILWWWEEGYYWILPNAVNHERVMAAFAARAGCEVEDLRPSTAFMALQGPRALECFTDVLGASPGRFRTETVTWSGADVRMAGTGYTGEPGGEICTDPATGEKLFLSITELVAPCGLGARDTLRLEAGLPLWGDDLDETRSPLEAGLDFAVSFDHDFTGKEALERQLTEGLASRLVGFILEERGVPRHGYRVRTSARSTGTVTSGNMSPLIGKGIGLAYLSPPPDDQDRMLEVEMRGRWVPGRIVEPPFHRK